MTSYAPDALCRAVAAICPDIRARIDTTSVSNERHLWWELSCCILSSQVPYSLAVAAADAIDKRGYLHHNDHSSLGLTDQLFEILSAPLVVDGKRRSYRFPKLRATQLAATRSAVTRAGGALNSLISGLNANDTRTWFVTNAPGVGPKQASMFLRNCGITYDQAILDRHVLNYMSTQGMYAGRQTSISGMNQYDRHEKRLRDHARAMDCPVGLLDWAIWIVMRVASKEQGAI